MLGTYKCMYVTTWQDLPFSCCRSALKTSPGVQQLQVTHGSTMFLYNMDFAMEWPRPLPPNVQLVGALLPTQAKPLPPQFEVGMQHHFRPVADAF